MRAPVAFLALVLWSALSAPSEAADRVALVIGNGAYAGTAALANPVRDATAIADKLKGLDFEVILATDVDRRGAIAAIDKFSKAIGRRRDGAHLLRRTWHPDRRPEFPPADRRLGRERAGAALQRHRHPGGGGRDGAARRCRHRHPRRLPRQSVRRAGRRKRRCDTLGRRGARARADAAQPAAVRIIAYAAASGDVAADGTGEHSPFTAALLQEIGEPEGRGRPDVPPRRPPRHRRDHGRPAARASRPPRRRGLSQSRQTERRNRRGRATVPAAAKVETAAAETTAGTAAGDGGASVAVADAAHQARAAPPAEGTVASSAARVVHPPPWVAGLDAAEADRLALAGSGRGRRSGGQRHLRHGAAAAAGSRRRGPHRAARRCRLVHRRRADRRRAAGSMSRPVPPEIDLNARVWNANHEVVADWQGGARPGGALAARFPLPVAGRYWIEMTDGNNDAGERQPFNVADRLRRGRRSVRAQQQRRRRIAPSRSSPSFAPTIYPRGDADWYKVWVPDARPAVGDGNRRPAGSRPRHSRLEPERPGRPRLGGAAATRRRHGARSGARRARHLSDRDRGRQ